MIKAILFVQLMLIMTNNHTTKLQPSPIQTYKFVQIRDTYSVSWYSEKKTILSNVIENINSRSQTDTIIEFSSAFDANLTVGLEERKELLIKPCSNFCVNYVHNVPPERGYFDYKVSIRYNKKINCTSNELIGQFNNLLPIINRL